jgi:hypothetical protein
MAKQSGHIPGSYLSALLVSRVFLFLIFQALIALITSSWATSEKYWLLSATLTNIVIVILLILLFRREGLNYLSVFRIDRSLFGKDILIFTGIVIISLPVIMAPGYFLSLLIWGDPNVPADMMFHPLGIFITYLLLIAFPVTIALAELALYFIYIMPRLILRIRSRWLAVLIPVIFLSIQHCTLPFIPDLNFIIYRALAFLPFALLIGVSICFRPSLFPYFAIFHGIIDAGTAFMFVLELQ